MHGKCLAKCPAYGTVSVYLAVDITVDQTLILKLKINCIAQTFSLCSHHNCSYLCTGFILRQPCNMVAKMGTGSSRLTLFLC